MTSYLNQSYTWPAMYKYALTTGECVRPEGREAGYFFLLSPSSFSLFLLSISLFFSVFILSSFLFHPSLDHFFNLNIFMNHLFGFLSQVNIFMTLKSVLLMRKMHQRGISLCCLLGIIRLVYYLLILKILFQFIITITNKKIKQL